MQRSYSAGFLTSVGIWVAVRLLGNETPGTTSAWTFMMAGLSISVVNSVLKPIVTILALPAILLTLGLFTLIVNGFMVYISLALAPGDFYDFCAFNYCRDYIELVTIL